MSPLSWAVPGRRSKSGWPGFAQKAMPAWPIARADRTERPRACPPSCRHRCSSCAGVPAGARTGSRPSSALPHERSEGSCVVPYLAELDSLTGEPIRRGPMSAVRYERERPGELVHLDVKKLGSQMAAAGACEGATTGPSGCAVRALSMCTRPSTTTRGWPTQRSPLTSAPPPARPFLAAPPASSLSTASPTSSE